jgi:two-component system alkaline phosphatase synthesis response regulator PhoP
MTELLLVDADAGRRLDVWDRLVEEGYRVTLASFAREGVERALAGGIDLVLLELSLPDGDGFGVCQALRRSGYAGGLILVSDLDHSGERVRALNLGADDVLTRPFQLVELCARIEACLRRRAADPPGKTCPVRFGNVEVDLGDARVAKGGQPVQVSPREFQLLRCLVERAGTPVTRAELLDCVWGQEATPSPQTVDVHVAWLRRKLEADPRNPVLIRTVHGVGYVLSDPGASRLPAE